MNETRNADPGPSLALALRRGAAELAAQEPPAGLQSRVLAAVAKARRPSVPRRHWAWSGAAACVTVLLGSAVRMQRLPPPAASGTAAIHAGDFMPLVPPDHWPQGAAPAWLVSAELSGERLAALGMPYDPARAGESVRAELLLHPSGEVLAVRFRR